MQAGVCNAPTLLCCQRVAQPWVLRSAACPRRIKDKPRTSTAGPRQPLHLCPAQKAWSIDDNLPARNKATASSGLHLLLRT